MQLGLRQTLLSLLLGTTLAVAACSPAADETTEESSTIGASNPAAETAELTLAEITAATFGCMRDMTPVGRFYVDNLAGNVDETVAIAESETGGEFPVGSLVQLVPGEVMIKREPGFSAETRDWEFFELNVSADGSEIHKRGHADVVNRFNGNCLECHAKAEAQWDMICSTDHGCDPIPLNDAMIRALQKTDPRCPPADLDAAEAEALALLVDLGVVESAN